MTVATKSNISLFNYEFKPIVEIPTNSDSLSVPKISVAPFEENKDELSKDIEMLSAKLKSSVLTDASKDFEMQKECHALLGNLPTDDSSGDGSVSSSTFGHSYDTDQLQSTLSETKAKIKAALLNTELRNKRLGKMCLDLIFTVRCTNSWSRLWGTDKKFIILVMDF